MVPRVSGQVIGMNGGTNSFVRAYDGDMKLGFVAWLLALAFSLTATMTGANLAEVKSVYLMPMANGLDQYLAVRLSNNGVVQVVTDPQKADAVMTDSLGAGFEEKFEDLYNKDRAAAKSDKVADKDVPDFSRGRVGGTRARGTIFVVDRKTHELIWSVYELPKRSSPDELNTTASRIADKLGRAKTAKN